MTKRRILVVDDEPSLSRLARKNLESTGKYEVREENDGKHTIQAARHFMPDLILMDVMMPGTDGGNIASELGQDPLLRDIPIIFLTGIVSGEEVAPTGSNIGGRTFLAKPVEIENLLACIESHLR